MEHRNKVLLAAVAVAIVAVLAASYLILPDDSHERRAHAFPDPIQDGDKEYPTAAEAQEGYDKVISSLEASIYDSSLDADAMKKAISDAEHEASVLKFKADWVALDYHKDPKGMSSEYMAWQDLVSVLNDELCTVIKDSMSGPCAGTVEEALKALGKDPGYYRSYGEMSPEEKELLQRQNELKAQYDTIRGTEYTVTDAEGRTWTLKAVAESATLTDEEKKLLTADIYAEKYTDAAKVYVELVQVNNDYAQLKGCSTYTEYAYKNEFGREYSASDTEAITALAGQAHALSRNAYSLADYTAEELALETAWTYSLDADGLIDAASPFIRSVSQDHSDLLDYMLEYGLINICEAEGRQTAAYTADLPLRGSAYIYEGSTGRGPLSLITLVHEFGHSANFCLVNDESKCYDVSEIHSQGLEALFCASGLIGNGSDKALSVIKMRSFASVLTTSLVLTELETWAYETEAATGSLTADQVCDRFSDILDSHGIVYGLSYDQKYYWASIMHVFRMPHYYISYGTSVINAMEIYLDAIDDYGSAKEKYFSLLFQEGVEGYVPAVEQAGLSNALDAERSKEILDGIEEALRAMGS